MCNLFAFTGHTFIRFCFVQVYVNMQQPERYPSKLEELKSTLADRLKQKREGDQGQQECPPCFISYCWQNSERAKAKGSRSAEGAAGYGDPRDIKDYLQEHSVPCWIDIERVGMVSGVLQWDMELSVGSFVMWPSSVVCNSFCFGVVWVYGGQ
jgi:hypothetical protein